MHGEPALNAEAKINSAQGGSPLNWLNQGNDVQIVQFGGNPNTTTPQKLRQNEQPQPDAVVINGKKVKEAQAGVEIWYDENQITPQQVRDIQLYKAGRESEIKLPSDQHDLHEYKRKLEQLGSYVIVRGEATQYHNTDGSSLKEPIDRVVYYANFPKLQKPNNFSPEPSLDYEHFVQNGQIAHEHELKEKFKDVLKLQARVADAHGEAIDVATPNAINPKDNSQRR